MQSLFFIVRKNRPYNALNILYIDSLILNNVSGTVYAGVLSSKSPIKLMMCIWASSNAVGLLSGNFFNTFLTLKRNLNEVREVSN